MTTAVLEALHQYNPEAVIDIIADKRSSSLFSQCPYRGQVIHKNKRAPFRGALELLRELRPTYYDLIVDLRTDGLAYLFRGKKRLTRWGAKPYGPHAVQQLMGVIRKLHGDKPIPSTRLWLDEKDESYAQKILSELPEGKVLALAPACGGAKAQKSWPRAHYSQLANNLKGLFSAVLLLGGPDDRADTTEIAEALSLPFADTAGNSLNETAALLKGASFFIGSDSGVGHIAAAMGVPTLSLFSNAEPGRYAPWGEQAEWIRDPSKKARNIKIEQVEKKVRGLI